MAEEGENLRNIWGEINMDDAPRAVAARRMREKLPPPRSARRALGTGAETKTAQLNVKIRPSLRDRISALAQAEGCSIPDLVERMTEAYSAGQA